MRSRYATLLLAVVLASLSMATSCVRFAVFERDLLLAECPSADAFPASFRKGEFELAAPRSGKICPGRRHYTLVVRQAGDQEVGDARVGLQWVLHPGESPKGCDLKVSLQIPCERRRTLAECLSLTPSGAKGGGTPTVGESKERFFAAILPAFLREGVRLSLKDAAHQEGKPVVSVRETDKPPTDTCD